MSRLTLVVVVAVVTLAAVNTAKGGCPVYSGIAWACAYMPKCFGDSMCPSGQQCCHHPCGDQCAVPCEKVNCGTKTCPHGFHKNTNGCATCDCYDPSKCKGLACLLEPKIFG